MSLSSSLPPPPSRYLGNDHRRQSLKSSLPTQEVDFGNFSNRSTSSPQLVSVKSSRSKVYRRASLKSLANLPVVSPASQSKILRVSKTEKRLLLSCKNNNNNNNDNNITNNNNKENIVCSPLTSPYPYSTPCHVKNNGDKLEAETEEEDTRKQSKGKSSCSSFLPILSLIPNTVISFQYPSPKMKFSWWRNKIS